MRSVPTCNVADVAAAARPFGMTLRQLVERSLRAAGRTELRRLYVGSNFCAQYFLQQPSSVWREAFALCRSEGIPATLTVPIFSQGTLAEGKLRICALMAEYGRFIDEVTVNDIGMLQWVSRHFALPVNAGRLFFKAPRDPRCAELHARTLALGVPPLLSELCSLGRVRGIEVDPAAARLNLAELCGFSPQTTVGVHMPYSYLSTGSICELASARLPVQQKFRPNQPCQMECARCAVTYRLHGRSAQPRQALAKWGRTVYFANHECTVCEGEEFRMIVSPLDVLLPRVVT